MKRLIGRAFLAMAGRRMREMESWRRDPVPVQQRQLQGLLASAESTAFGQEHGFYAIDSVADYQARVPLRQYLDFKPYWDRLFQGESDVTWRGRIRYFAVTSGTTAGNKYIPVSHEGVHSHLRVGRDILNAYVAQTQDVDLFQGRFLYLGGSTRLKRQAHGLLSGDLSGILTREMPTYTRLLRLPTASVTALSDWEQKLDAVAGQAWRADVRAIGGTPSWLVCVFERVLRLHREAGRRVSSLAEIWPRLSLLVHGGVNFEPYRATFRELFGKPVHTLDVYPASEGFIAFQDRLGADDLLLNLDIGIFYEFVPVEELSRPAPRRFTVADVEPGVNYAIVLTTNSGLWSYVIGDTVRFTSLRPHRVHVTGRTQQFLSAFGEHLIVEDVEAAMTAACAATGAELADYHVAPVFPGDGEMRPAHEWLTEFIKAPADPERFARVLDEALRKQNADYADHRSGDAGMRPPVITPLPAGAFYATLKASGKFGPQVKAPRLRNDREFAALLRRTAGLAENEHGPEPCGPGPVR